VSVRSQRRAAEQVACPLDRFIGGPTPAVRHATGDLEIAIASDADLERAKPLLDRAYHAS
jgi:hypothetical protein